MSFHSNDSAIKRFTYDWLIRFAELHPFLVAEYFDISFRNQWDLVAPDERRPPDYPSKYAKISPLFTSLITRHMPYLFYSEYVNMAVKNGKILTVKRVDENGNVTVHLREHEHKLPSQKKWKIIISQWCQFVGLQPGMISWFEDNRVIFYREHLSTYVYSNIKCRMTPNELKYLLKCGNFDTKVEIHATLVKPVEFSDICPLIPHCDEIVLDVKNLIFTDNVANVLRENQICPSHLCLFKLDISEEAVLEIFEYFSKLQNRPNFFCFKFTQSKPETLAKAIIDKYKRPGMELELLSMRNTQFNGFNMETIDNVKLTFRCFYH